MPNQDKERVIQLVNGWLKRSALNIDQVVARMQSEGCDISRSTFENRFTTRVEQKPNIPPEWTLTLVQAFVDRMLETERCTATEAVEFARLTRLPIDRFKDLAGYFPETEFSEAYAPYLVAVDGQRSSAAEIIQKRFDAVLTYLPNDDVVARELSTYLVEEVGLNLWPDIFLAPSNGRLGQEQDEAIKACHTWVLCIGSDNEATQVLADLRNLTDDYLHSTDTQVIPVLMPGANLGTRSQLPRFLQRISWLTFDHFQTRTQALLQLSGLIRQATPIGGEAASRLVDNRCPYRGLRAFDEMHADFFFGREADVGWLIDAMRHVRFVAVIGPSGVGKSSLVRAGLLPTLRQGDVQFQPSIFNGRSTFTDLANAYADDGLNSAQCLIQTFQPGWRPLESLALALLDLRKAGTQRGLRDFIDDLTTDDQGLHLLTLEILAQYPDKSLLTLVIDQFEETFTLCQDPEAQQKFIANLLHATTVPDGCLSVIITLRADFYSQAAMHTDLSVYLADSQVLISPMTGSELRRAIVRPAREVGLQFDAGLVEALLQDAAGEPGALPLVQHALLELWERRNEDTLTFAAYQEIGGVQGALAKRADKLLAALSPSEQETVRHVMLNLIQLGEGTSDTRRRATLNELVSSQVEAESIRTVIGHLADARLVTTASEAKTGKETVELAHEALIEGWPTLQDWLDEDRDALRIKRHLEHAAQAWQDHNQDQSYLYRGARLAEAEAWADALTIPIDESTSTFLEASLAARSHETKARDRRRRQVTIALTLGLALALIALSVVLTLSARSARQGRELLTQQEAAFSRELAGHANAQLPTQTDLALLLAVEAYRAAATFEAKDSLLSTLQFSPYLETYLRAHSDWVWQVAYHPSEDILASAGADGKIIFWNLTTRQPIGDPIASVHGRIRSIAFSPNGQLLASGDASGQVQLWDVSDLSAGAAPIGAPLSGHTSFITQVAFNPDGTYLGSASADGNVILWDVADFNSESVQPLAQALTDHTSFVLDLAFSPDGKFLATASEDDTVILWDVETKKQAQSPIRSHTQTVSAVAFSPDSKLVASAGQDQIIHLWDVEARRPIDPPLTGHNTEISGLSFSPDGKLLVSSGRDGTLLLWDMTTKNRLSHPLVGHADRVLNVTFSSSGQQIASSSADGTIILWDVSPDKQHVGYALGLPLRDHNQWVLDLAFAPTGQLISAGRAGDVRIWELTSNSPSSEILQSKDTAALRVSVNPDGSRLAIGWYQDAISLIDMAEYFAAPQNAPDSVSVGEAKHEIRGMAFSPDGRYLATGSTHKDGVTILDTETLTIADQFLEGIKSGLAYTADGQDLIIGDSAGSEPGLTWWDMDVKKSVAEYTSGSNNEITSMAMSADGNLVATADTAFAIRLWAVSTSSEPEALQLVRQPLVIHSDIIFDLAFSPDGLTLASVGRDGRIGLRDVETHQILGQLIELDEEVLAAAFSPDGRYLATAGHADGTIIVWNLDPDSWQEKACQIAARNLTQAEWERYFVDKPYRATCPQWPIQPSESQIQPASTARSSTTNTTSIPLTNSIGSAIIEEFDLADGFIQTSENVFIDEGKVVWHIERSKRNQFVYRSIPPFQGNFRLTVQGQVDDWTNNCSVAAGIGDKPGSGIAIQYGWTGGGCETNGVLVFGKGYTLDQRADECNYTGNWLWGEKETPYTAELNIIDDVATLSVDGIGTSTGDVLYDDVFTTLWVGNFGGGDWPECWGNIESVAVEPLP